MWHRVSSALNQTAIIFVNTDLGHSNKRIHVAKPELSLYPLASLLTGLQPKGHTKQVGLDLLSGERCTMLKNGEDAKQNFPKKST